jgi:hypothetical protein
MKKKEPFPCSDDGIIFQGVTFDIPDHPPLIGNKYWVLTLLFCTSNCSVPAD